MKPTCDIHVLGLAVVLCLSLLQGVTYGKTPEVVCRNVDVRNDLKNLVVLENCTVIEGYLQIVHLESYQKEDYDKYRFPKLVEVTGFFLLYHVLGLRTLRKMFPNLAVIRGQELFFNYALALFENKDLEEIGLIGLTEISRGGLRMEKNPSLCFIETIDWPRIIREKGDDVHFIKSNNNLCISVEFCPDSCEKRPSSAELTKVSGDKEQRLCWSDVDCQKTCPSHCKRDVCSVSNDERGTYCCNTQCIGGCYGRTDRDCVACRHYSQNGRCVTNCRTDLLAYKGRCITSTECKTNNRMLYQKLNIKKCVSECPAEYKKSQTDHHLCVRCEGHCPKVCTVSKIEGVSDVQLLKGCTEINGSLEIQILGGDNVGVELQKNLGMIEVVHDYIRIVRSNALVSLDFLSKLREIKGAKLVGKGKDKYALQVLDNRNLQDIWNMTRHPRLTINGRVFFHINPKLCVKTIKRFLNSTGFDAGVNGTYSDFDISPKTNGDKAACNIATIDLKVDIILPNVVVLSWKPLKGDQRQILSYVASYRQAPEKNISIFDGMDACGDYVWTVQDVTNQEEGDKIIYFMGNLKPFTQYAVYVRAYTIVTHENNQGAQSNIIYVKTRPYFPSPPRNVEVVAEKEGELTVRWLPPEKPNGIIAYYRLYWQPRPIKEEKFTNRDFCSERLRLLRFGLEKPIKEEENENNTTSSCSCARNNKKKAQAERDRLMEITFENFLQNTLYIKRPPDSGRNSNSNATEITQTPMSTISPAQEITPISKSSERGKELTTSETKTTYIKDRTTASESLVNRTTESPVNKTTETPGENVESDSHWTAAIVIATDLVIPNLKHFTPYAIEIWACDATGNFCTPTVTTARTKKKPLADSINESTITFNTTYHAADISWGPPSDPNGLVLAYELEYQKIDEADVKPIERCISKKKFSAVNGYTIKQLRAGNYTFRVRVLSLAGNGSWTNPQYLSVPQRRVTAGDPEKLPIVVVVGAVTGVVVCIVVSTLVCFWFVKKRRLQGFPPDTLQVTSVNPEYMSTGDVYIPDKWEVEREKIHLLRELGQGSFGMVYEGLFKHIDGEETQVAVKTVNENASIRDRIEFLNEASVMKAFKCHHVVRLLGVVSKGQPTLVVMELMARGDLKNFLRQHRPDEPDNEGRQPSTLQEILQMAGEIADGMAYLTAKKYVHRDLAARNCMVHEDMTVKIGDFGMTRDIYETDYYRKGGKGLLPVRWMGPESLKDGVFTSQSDVWSYGVVLWEMATLAAQPYQGLSNEQVLKYVIEGHLMERPDECPDSLWNLMMLCWQYYPSQRYTFNELLEILGPDMNDKFRKNSFFLSEENNKVVDNEYLDNISIKTPLTHDCTDSEIELNTTQIHTVKEPVDCSKVHYEPNQDNDNSSDQSKSISCECIKQTLANEMKKRRRSSSNSNNANPSYPVSSSNEGSKGSSKSSSSGAGYSHLNGFLNGHTNIHMIRSTKC